MQVLNGKIDFLFCHLKMIMVGDYLPTVEMKNYNVIIDARNFFDQPIKNDLKTYDNISKIATGQGDD